MHHIIIPMNFLSYNFKLAQAEYEREGKIFWQIPVNPSKKKGLLTVNKRSSLVKMAVPGSKIFFYICNLPGLRVDTCSRILLCGNVCDEPSVMPYEKIYNREGNDGSNNKMCTGFTISNLQTLKSAVIEDDSRYDSRWLYEQLTLSSGDVFRNGKPRGKNWISDWDSYTLKPEDQEKVTSLFKELDDVFVRNASSQKGFDTLIKHYDRECFLKNRITPPSFHSTFARRNGLAYLEKHHFIPKHAEKQFPELSPLINDEADNLIHLCSNCHNLLHYGKPDEIEKRIRCIWEDTPVKTMLKKYDRYNEETLNWLLNDYKAHIDKKRKKDYD